MSDTPRFFSVEDVLVIHANAIGVEGGSPGLQDSGLLEAAVLMPQQRFGGEYLHRGLAAMAASYLFHISQDHAFYDGNNRTAVAAPLVFLEINGIETLPEPNGLEDVTLAVTASEMSNDELTDWMTEHVGSD